MSLASDIKTLYHLALSPIRGNSHKERLESFYKGQAKSYDAFRAHLLHGRQELWQDIPVPEGGIWVDMGCGTGVNLEFIGDKIDSLAKVYAVDLTPSLLIETEKRINDHGWNHVQAIEADATEFVPVEEQVDLVTFSYSLTMIPDWFAAIDQAFRILKPGGVIAIVDFYVSRKYPAPGFRKHGWFKRSFWPVWLGSDNVWASSEHVPYLYRKFSAESFSEHLARMRYMPLTTVPYYRFVGRKPAMTTGCADTQNSAAASPISADCGTVER